MSTHYLSVTEVANMIGVKTSALAIYNMPEPDAYIGKTRGWLPETIKTWNANRPGHGGRPRKTNTTTTIQTV